MYGFVVIFSVFDFSGFWDIWILDISIFAICICQDLCVCLLFCLCYCFGTFVLSFLFVDFGFLIWYNSNR